MRLGDMLGEGGVKEMDRIAVRQQRIIEKRKRKAREADMNRKRSRGELIRYRQEDN